MSHDRHCFTIHTDPGHGWAEVPAALVAELGFRVSRFSYQHAGGGTLFLEEDCDLARFVEAYRDRFGITPTFREQHTDEDSFIRSLDRVSWVSPS